jgi:hypothetical protein
MVLTTHQAFESPRAVPGRFEEERRPFKYADFFLDLLKDSFLNFARTAVSNTDIRILVSHRQSHSI